MRCAQSVDHAGLEEHRAWYVLATRGFVVVAAVSSVAADVVHVHNLARRSSLEAGSTRQRKVGEGRSNVRNSVWQFYTETGKAGGTREYPEQKNEEILPLLPLEPWAPCKARWVWAGAVIFASATCSLQFAKASATTLFQQEKNNSADVQRGRVNISSFICTVVS
jgi:hypothetical protein